MQDEATSISGEFAGLYDDLRTVAARELRAERRNHTLRATALVHEAYLRLSKTKGVQWSNRSHFLAMAAKTMRQVLVDHARARRCAKRGGAAERITLCEGHLIAQPELDVEALDQALARLEAFDTRQSQIVEMRFFAGMSAEEIADVLDVSSKTVKRDWAMARAWLRLQLTGLEDAG